MKITTKSGEKEKSITIYFETQRRKVAKTRKEELSVEVLPLHLRVSATLR